MVMRMTKSRFCSRPIFNTSDDKEWPPKDAEQSQDPNREEKEARGRSILGWQVVTENVFPSSLPYTAMSFL